MYCPNCGQPQMSDEMRFCSRCGLSLSGLTEWLAAGRLPERSADYDQVAIDSPRRKGIRRGAKLMFFSGVLFPVFLGLGLLIDEGGVLFVPLAIFFVSLVLILYARLFSDKTARLSPPPAQTPVVQNSAFGSNPTRGSLTPATNISMPSIGRQRVRTNELAQPSSVTENTTRLLDE